ncbi:MAG: Gldg family protein [bacterium]
MAGSSKLQLRLSHAASLFFILFIFAAVNFIGYKKYARKDFSINRYLTLSEQSMKALDHLPGSVTITLLAAQEPDVLAGLIRDDVENLLKEYAYQSKGKIIVRNVNLFTDVEIVRALVSRFKLTDNEDVLIVEYGEQSRVLKVAELAAWDSSGLMESKAPTVQAFKGEQEITGALMALTQGKAAKVYFTAGHGEPSLGEFSALSDRIKGQNAEALRLNMTETGGVPQDADMVVIAGPQFPFTADEIASLKSYLERNGRLFLLLGPQHKSGLENFLESYGVVFDDDFILQPVVGLSSEGLVQGVSMDAIGSMFGAHSIIAWIQQTGSDLPLGASRSLTVREQPNRPVDQNAPEVTVLIQTTEKAWGETAYADLQKPSAAPKFDKNKDRAGPLPLAVVIDTGAVQGGQVSLQGAKIVAVGASNFLLDSQLGALQADFFLNAMNWMLQKQQALGITAKVPQEFKLTLTEAQRQTLALFILIIIPFCGAASGVFVWWSRRK